MKHISEIIDSVLPSLDIKGEVMTTSFNIKCNPPKSTAQASLRIMKRKECMESIP